MTSIDEAFLPMMQQEIMLEFRAGKMSLQGTRVVPDSRKGLVRIVRGDEGLVHFMWLDRNLNTVEDEPRAEGDAELCSSVNQYLNQPIEFQDEDELAAAVTDELLEDMAEDNTSSRAGNLVVPNLSTEVSDVTSSAGPVKLADLQRILNNLSAGPVGIAGDEEGLALGDILKPELIMPLLEMLPVQERLSSHLPEGHCRAEDILELLQSPPFRQQIDAFTYVLRTGQIDLTQFGIDPSKFKFTVVSFLEALEDSVSTQSKDAMDET